MPERDVSAALPPAVPPGPEGNRPPGPGPRGPGGPAVRPPRRPGRKGGRGGKGGVGGRKKAVVFTLATAAIVAVAVWALLGSTLLVVRSVTVTGADAVPRAEVLRAAGIAPGTPLIRVDTAAVARRVERITQVQSAQVSRDWPDSVTIVIQERTPVLAVPSDGGFALVDRFGVVVSHAATRPPGMVLLDTAANPDSLRGSPAVGAAVTVLHELPPRILRLVRAVTAPSPGAVTLDLRGDVTVLWGGTDRAAAKAAELEILMRTKASSYDLSDPYTAVTGG
jgi:cell division protein FtsQ